MTSNETLKTLAANSENQSKAANQELKIENLASLDIDTNLEQPRLTGIICTIGPSSNNESKLLEMMAAGMNIARLNFAHGTHEEHAATIDKIREAVKVFSENCAVSEAPIAIAIDTKGTGIRTGSWEGGVSEVELEAGQTIKVTADEAMKAKGTTQLLYIDNKEVIKLLKPGNRIYIDNGLVSLLVRITKKDYLICDIENKASLGSHKGLQFPGVNVKLPAISEQDILDIQFAIDNNVDILFASHIKSSEGIKQIRKALGENGKHIHVLAKIENPEAVENIDDIIAASDGVVVARGELGIEIPMEKVFLAQKMITAKCNKLGKPVVCATQMLESMVWNPRPTRAECSDIANAVLDGVDCIVLTGETARGKYPIDAVCIASSVCREAEAAFFTKYIFHELLLMTPPPTVAQSTVAIAAVTASLKSHAAAIIVISSTGHTAQLISRYRPRCPILLVSRHKHVTRQAHLYRGLLPVWLDQPPLNDWQKDIDNRVRRSFEIGKRRGFLKPGDQVILVQGWRRGGGATNSMRIVIVVCLIFYLQCFNY